MQDADSDNRKCPFCAEWIKREAILCKHCKSAIEPDVQNEATTSVESSSPLSEMAIGYLPPGKIVSEPSEKPMDKPQAPNKLSPEERLKYQTIFFFFLLGLVATIVCGWFYSSQWLKLALQGSGGGIFLFLCCLFYFVPSVIAVLKRSRAVGFIIVLNIFFGWTGLGWLLLLVWSLL